VQRHPLLLTLLALALVLLPVAACQAWLVPLLVRAPTETPFSNASCGACDQATQIPALTQANISLSAQQAQATATAGIQMAHALASANAATATQSAVQAEQDIGAIALQAQAAATADILRAQALATANAASSTQGAALTQVSLNASAQQAAAAASAAAVKAEALATANAASSTQASALTQAALVQTQVQRRMRFVAQSATQSVAATGTQQWLGAQVAGTATMLARAMIDQTQSAATVARQAAGRRQEQNQAPLVFMWKWGLPIFIVAVAALSLWGFWRWLRIHTARPRTVARPASGSVTIRARTGSLAESLANRLRGMAWFAERRSTAPAGAGAVVVSASPPEPAVAATPGADITTGPAPDLASEAPPAVTTNRIS